MVIPGYNPYSNWYQKCSLDRKGNYYLLYYYIALRMQGFPKVYAEYQKKWPEEGNDPAQVKAHDPVVAGYYNGKWHIATTPLFWREMNK